MLGWNQVAIGRLKWNVFIECSWGFVNKNYKYM
jgi:hypothetical protein